VNFENAMKNSAGTVVQPTEKLAVSVNRNPSYTDFTLLTKTNSDKPVSFIVTDVLGRVMERKVNVAANTTVQLGSRLQAGIYFVQIIQGNRSQQLKLIKK